MILTFINIFAHTAKPVKHSEALLLPSWEVVIPSEQSVHDSAFSVSLNVPVGHAVHDSAFSVSLYVPVGHAIHPLLTVSLKFPALHSKM